MTTEGTGPFGPGTPGLSVVVPAYNEAERIVPTLQRVSAYLGTLGEPAEVIVVDDGSSDNTAAVIRQAMAHQPRIRLEVNPENLGKGASVRRGVLAARFAHVLFTDADLSAPIEDVAKLRQALAAGADIAIGSRRLPGSVLERRQPPRREWLGHAFSWLVRAFLLPGIHDSQCGFKAFRREVAQAVFSRQRLDGYGFDVEILWIARRLGYRVAEVPIRWADHPVSHIRPVRDGLRMLSDLGRIRLADWRGDYRHPRKSYP